MVAAAAVDGAARSSVGAAVVDAAAAKMDGMRNYNQNHVGDGARGHTAVGYC